MNTYEAEMAHVPENVSAEEREAIEAFIAYRREHAVRRGIDCGHFYQLTADSVMLDHRPDYAKRFYDGIPAFMNRLRAAGEIEDRGTEALVASLGHFVMYVLYGWETGIYNEFRHFQARGLTKAQIMEFVMYAQLNTGIRGLQLVYNAVGKHLVDWQDGPREVQRTETPAEWPRGWEPDPDAFLAGLDMSVRELTAQDRANIEAWYDKNVGFLPRSVSFSMDNHPEFYKWQRARWEIIFQDLPKQVLPYMMVRQHMLTGFKDALREAVLLGKNWGISKEWMNHAFMVTAWYTGFEGLLAVDEAVGDVMRDWQD